MSVDSIGIITQQAEGLFNTSAPTFQSPRKLTKRRPSADSVSPKNRAAGASAVPPPRPRRPSSPEPPIPSLPPVVSLSPLTAGPDPDQNQRPSVNTNFPQAMGTRPSPGLNTPNSVFSSQHNEEPQDYFWSDLTDPSRTDSPVTRGNPALLPAASVTREAASDRKKGHTRSRSAAKSSGDSTKRDRANKPSQKAMLSRALSKANAAVQLDNALNYGAAREAYIEACDLLQHVLARTNGEEDRKKLEAIRQTYTARIDELDGLVMVNPQVDRPLPSRPDSIDYHGFQTNLQFTGNEGNSEASTSRRMSRADSDTRPPPNMGRRPSESRTHTDYSRSATPADQHALQASFTRSPMRRNFEGPALNVPRGNESNIMPAPLSPRRPISPSKAPSPEPIIRHDFSFNSDRLANPHTYKSHRRNASHESASWLDPIDESGGSAPSSSVHSRSSSVGIRRKHLRQVSGVTEDEFDAALDAAVEAAYDDGFEPAGHADTIYEDDDGGDSDIVANAMRKVEIAKERVRQTEREAAIELARERERQRQMSISQTSQSFNGDFFDANDSDEEEERMLDEITRDYVMEDFSMGASHPSVPRASDSSGHTSGTWHSSMGSNAPTSATTAGGLSTVNEMSKPNSIPRSTPATAPPPTQPLPPAPARPPSASGVRTRRLSGQNPKQLKIETTKIGQPPNVPLPPIQTSVNTKTGSFLAQQRQAQSATSTRAMPFSMRAPASPTRGGSPADAMVPPSPTTKVIAEHDESRTGSPTSVRVGLRKNFSSSSLKSLKNRQVSTVSHMEDSDMSPNTPLTHQTSHTSFARQPVPALPTPLAAAFLDNVKTGGFGGLHLFDSDFHSPIAHSPASPERHQTQNPDIPLPLEPCPSDALLRPFWLMRALYQTLAHPRGGYISNRLFVPRDAWKVKGVKLKLLEDKMSQCDFLTAALLKLARVDSTDADAVLEEMQNFENILEVVQQQLTRKLGNEVGSQGVNGLQNDRDGEQTPVVPRNNSVSAKTGGFSWRRLRGKGSAANMSSAYGTKGNSSGGNGNPPERDPTSTTGSIPSLPMTAHPSSRPAKRDVASLKFDGPWANYMSSLARLFDAAQVIDQIARQVDDPGLRHADKTQVGLELSTRHAAEFFAFYICRFVMADLSLLLDKFVKRGSEWVLN
ncbi:hypothetical protein F4780DRAFT_767805 [Xylariomycetidae sp. FL0641]|nr:hypothetical protein F4780DRAFT_767805 [Xylariomycetidae sp. FL0641]